MKRAPVNKTRDSNNFRSMVTRTKYINIAPPPMRGGYRL
jgi:hypothetical protein